MSDQPAYESNRDKFARIAGSTLLEHILTNTGTTWTPFERNLARLFIKAHASGDDVGEFLLRQAPKVWIGAGGKTLLAYPPHSAELLRLSEEKVSLVEDAISFAFGEVATDVALL